MYKEQTKVIKKFQDGFGENTGELLTLKPKKRHVFNNGMELKERTTG